MTLLLILLLIKHFVLDYVWQPPWMLNEKTPYGAAGGIAHAGVHGLGTFMCVLFFVNLPAAILLAILDTALHYHVDYAKTVWSNLHPTTPDQPKFWFVHGLDQLLHHITYVMIAAICVWI